jgi:hypothetical protein
LQFCPAGVYVTAQKMRQDYCINPLLWAAFQSSK